VLIWHRQFLPVCFCSRRARPLLKVVKDFCLINWNVVERVRDRGFMLPWPSVPSAPSPLPSAPFPSTRGMLSMQRAALRQWSPVCGGIRPCIANMPPCAAGRLGTDFHQIFIPPLLYSTHCCSFPHLFLSSVDSGLSAYFSILPRLLLSASSA
jgi:hypothetical protein